MKILPIFILFVFFSSFVCAQNCLQTAKITAPEISENTRKVYETKLSEAKADLDKNPNNADAMIWFGRRTAYPGNYREAIRIFTGGIEKFPREARFYRHCEHRLIMIRCFDAKKKTPQNYFAKSQRAINGRVLDISRLKLN